MFEAGHGDPGAHGRFDDQAGAHAFPFDPAWLRAGVAGIAALAVTAALTGFAKSVGRGK